MCIFVLVRDCLDQESRNAFGHTRRSILARMKGIESRVKNELEQGAGKIFAACGQHPLQAEIVHIINLHSLKSSIDTIVQVGTRLFQFSLALTPEQFESMEGVVDTNNTLKNRFKEVMGVAKEVRDIDIKKDRSTCLYNLVVGRIDKKALDQALLIANAIAVDQPSSVALKSSALLKIVDSMVQLQPHRFIEAFQIANSIPDGSVRYVARYIVINGNHPGKGACCIIL